MSNVATILARKGLSSIAVQADTSVFEALQIMADKNIGSLVVKEGDKYLGIVTERDYSRKVILQGKHSSETKVEEIMSSNVPEVAPLDSVERCMELMSDKNIRYLPVVHNGTHVGIISISDVVKETILQQKETINHLKNYIHS